MKRQEALYILISVAAASTHQASARMEKNERALLEQKVSDAIYKLYKEANSGRMVGASFFNKHSLPLPTDMQRKKQTQGRKGG